MEKKQRKARATGSSSRKGEKKPSPGITFETFFAQCVARGKLKLWQHDEIAAFFKDMRLRDKEDPKVYEETLERY